MASGRGSGYSLFVGNLSYQTTEDDLGRLFSQSGHVTSIRLMHDRETGRPKGFGFCEFADEKSAEHAISTLDGTEFNGRSIRVNWANSK